MKEIRKTFEEDVLQRPHVKTKRMFGCPSYTAKRKLFAFFVTDGIVLTKLGEDQRVDALNVPGAQFFEHNQRVVKKWVRIPLNDTKALGTIQPFVNSSYENAMIEEE